MWSQILDRQTGSSHKDRLWEVLIIKSRHWWCTVSVEIGPDPGFSKSNRFHAMIRENRQLVTNKPVEFEK